MAYRAAEAVRSGEAWSEKRWQKELRQHLGDRLASERHLRQVLGLDRDGLVWGRDRIVDFVVGLDEHRVPVELKLLPEATKRPDVMSLIGQGIIWSAALGGALLVLIDTSPDGVDFTPIESGLVRWLGDAGIVMLRCRDGVALRAEQVWKPAPWRTHEEDLERERVADLLAGAVGRSARTISSDADLRGVVREQAAALGEVKSTKAVCDKRLFGLAPRTACTVLRTRSGRRYAIDGRVLVSNDPVDGDALLQCAIASAHLDENLDGYIVVTLNRKSPKNAVHLEQSRAADVGARLARVQNDLGIDWRLINAKQPDDVIRLPGILPRRRDLPAPKAQLDDFGQTFFGYSYWRETGTEENGGMSAQICREVQQEFASSGQVGDNLARIRTALFFEQRRAHHIGYALTEREPFVRALLAALRRNVQS